MAVDLDQKKLSRRRFLKPAGVLTAGLSAGGLLAAWVVPPAPSVDWKALYEAEKANVAGLEAKIAKAKEAPGA